MEEDRFAVVFLFFRLPVLVFFGEVDRENLSEEHGGEDRAYDAQRIGAGVGNRDVFAFIVKKIERLLRGAEARGVRDRPVMDAQHLRKRDPVLQEEPERDRHDDPEEDDHDGEEVQNESPALEGREEGGPHLQPHEEDEEREAEVADEEEHGLRHREAEVSRGESDEKDEGDAERNARHLDASEKRPQGDDERVDENDVRHGVRVGKECAKPVHTRKTKRQVPGRISVRPAAPDFPVHEKYAAFYRSAPGKGTSLQCKPEPPTGFPGSRNDPRSIRPFQ